MKSIHFNTESMKQQLFEIFALHVNNNSDSFNSKNENK